MFRTVLLRPAALLLGAGLVLGTGRAGAELPEFRQLVKDNSAAVVNISTTQKVRAPRGAYPGGPMDPNDPMNEFFRRFFGVPPGQGGEPGQRDARSLGSGFVISADGIVMTNAHVVKGADEIIVRLSDHREVPAKLLGLDERTDVAVLKVEAKNLPAVKLGDSDRLEVGEWVLAIGSPFGLDYTATQGIVSAVGRTLPSDTYVPFIQTDVAVNPGNSGGPLFNTRGEVVGVNSQIYSRTGGYMGLSFAIPINVAMTVAQQIQRSGKATHGWLGVAIQPVTPELADSFGMDRARGALVASVAPDGPAAKAGLQSGDVILAFNGKPVEQAGDLPPLVGATNPGSAIKLRLVRDKKERDLTVKVESLKPEADEDAEPDARIAPQAGVLGLLLEDLTAEQRKVVGVEKGGAVVVGVAEGPADRAGLRRGDVLLRVNNENVTGAAQVRVLLGKLPKGRPVPILVQRNGSPLFLALTVPK